LTKAGKKVQVFEEHQEIGKPVQCTGIVTSEFEDIMELKKSFVVNKASNVKIRSVSGKTIDLKLRKPNYILDRAKFDLYLANKAEKNGADFFLESKLIGGNKNFFTIKGKNKTRRVRKEILIGADGPLSNVAKLYDMYTKRKIMLGFQYRVYLENDNCIEFYPGVGAYSWIAPEGSGICRIGIVDYLGQNIRRTYDFFIKRIGIRKKQMIDCQAGLIPIYNSRIRFQKDRVFLIGDAAAQVKATTGGGIAPGLIAAKGLADAIINKRNYKDNIWKLKKELLIHKLTRNILDNFRKKDWDYLFMLFENKKNKEILSTIERERVSKLLVPLLQNDPRFLHFAKRLIF
jgi:digeranylgeranylglycerophospholipid reductase